MRSVRRPLTLSEIVPSACSKPARARLSAHGLCHEKHVFGFRHRSVCHDAACSVSVVAIVAIARSTVSLLPQTPSATGAHVLRDARSSRARRNGSAVTTWPITRLSWSRRTLAACGAAFCQNAGRPMRSLRHHLLPSSLRPSAAVSARRTRQVATGARSSFCRRVASARRHPGAQRSSGPSAGHAFRQSAD